MNLLPVSVRPILRRACLEAIFPDVTALVESVAPGRRTAIAGVHSNSPGEAR